MVVAGVKEDRFSDLEDDGDGKDLFSAVTLTPAKVGDEDYAVVSDYTNTATVETIANALQKATGQPSPRHRKRRQRLPRHRKRKGN